MKTRLERLLAWLVPSWAADALLGDLDEEFARVAAARGHRVALCWYAWQVLTVGVRYAWHRREPPPDSIARGPVFGVLQHTMRNMAGDVRIAVRQLLRSPVFAVTAILSLGLGIGANATVAAFANALLFKPLAVHEPDRVVRIAAITPSRESAAFTQVEVDHIRRSSTLLRDVAAVHLATIAFRGLGVQEQLLGELASAEYFALRRPHVLLGRTIAAEDDGPGASPVAVVSERFWRRLLGADPEVLGRPAQINGQAFTIVGVFGDAFYGSFIAAPVDVWLPLASASRMLGSDSTDPTNVRALQVLARLQPSVTMAAAADELIPAAREIARLRDERDGIRLQVRPGTLLHGRSRRMAVLLLAVIGALTATVLLIAASNVANLVLARAIDRQRDLAIRVALGASRARVLAQLSGEGLVLAAAGGALGAFATVWATRAFGSLALLPGLELRLDLTPDWKVALATALFAAVAGVAASVVPGLGMMRHDMATPLKEGGGSVGSRRTARLRAVLAVAQIAIATVAALGAGLLARSARTAAATDLGFRTLDAFALDIDLTALSYSPDRAREFYRVLLERAGALRSFDAVALANRAPLDPSTPVLRAQYTDAQGAQASAEVTSAIVAGRYFEALAVPLLAGRPFGPGDSAKAPRVAVVNEVLARRLEPGAPPSSAIGRLIRLSGSSGDLRLDGDVRIVGVARTAKYQTVGEADQPHVYLPHAQALARDMALLLHAPGRPSPLPDAQQLLASIDPAVQGFFARTLEEHTSVALAPARLLSAMSLAAGSVATALSAIGLYGVIAFLVTNRRRDIAVRLALGATPKRVAGEVLGTALRLALIGAGFGLIIAAPAARLLAGVLYATSPWDPAIYGGALLTILLIASAASWLPARRASRLDPLTVLRD